MHPYEADRQRREADRIEAENLAFKIGHLTATFEHIAQQADELRLRRAKAWASACQPAIPAPRWA